MDTGPGSAPPLHGLRTRARRRQAATAEKVLPGIAAQGRPPRGGGTFTTLTSALFNIQLAPWSYAYLFNRFFCQRKKKNRQR